MARRSDLVKLLDQLQSSKAEVASIGLRDAPEEIRNLVARKREIYSEVARLRLENRDINDTFIRFIKDSPIATARMKDFRVLLCW